MTDPSYVPGTIPAEPVGPPVQPEEEFEDYFGFGGVKKWYFPDGVQYIEFQLLNGGQRDMYQSRTSRPIKVDRKDDSASLTIDQASDRKTLALLSVVDWYVLTKNSDGHKVPVPFVGGGSPGGSFGQWYSKANPKFLDDLDEAIRKANPWMQSEATVEDIDKSIADLMELRESAVKREESKALS